MIFSSSLWYFDYNTSREKIIQDTELNSVETVEHIQKEIIEHIELINSIMMTEWISTENESDLSDHNRFLELVPGFFNYSDSYLAINYINTSDVISWVYPYETNQGALNRPISFLADGSRNEAFIQSRLTYQLRVTPVIQLFQGITGVASYLPIIYQHHFVGMFNVVFQIEPFVDRILEIEHRQKFSYHLLDDDTFFYVHGSEFKHTDSFVITDTIKFYNREWELHTRPNEDLRFQGSIYNNIEILFFGLIATLVSFAFSRFIVRQNNLLEKNYKKREELEKIMFQYQKMDDLGILAGGIAHDFNNLLMGLQGNFALMTDIQLEILQNNDSTDPLLIKEMKEVSISIEELLSRSVKLTSQILSFSRQSITDLEYIDIKMLIESTLSIMAQSIDKRIVISQTYEASPMFVYGNSSKMSQLIMNVILNSIEAQPNGGTIEIDLRMRDFESNHINSSKLDNSVGFNREKMLVLKIKDSGAGIEKENLDKLFVPFYTTKTQSKKGTGLGLAIAYRSVITMFGDIIINSIQNVGTTVNIFLPIITENQLQQKNISFQLISDEELESIDIKSQNNISSVEIPEETKDAKSKIMIVDDEPSIRKLLGDYLKENHSIYECENGQAAVQFYQENSDFELIILDINIPGLNGIEVQKRMLEINPNQKILFITGYSENSISMNPSDNIHILAKPFSKSNFLSKVTNIFVPIGCKIRNSVVLRNATN